MADLFKFVPGILSNVIDLLNPASNKDIIAVYNDAFEQIIPDARPIKCTIKESSAMFMHPIETGETIADHRVILPVDVELVFVTGRGEERAVYVAIKQLYLQAKRLTVQTRVATYSNLYISDMPHTEDAEMWDAIKITVRMKEAQFVAPQYATLPPTKVKDKKDSTTVKRGTQTAKAPTEAQKEKGSSILFDASKKVSDFLGF